jgi:hypothetical protein
MAKSSEEESDAKSSKKVESSEEESDAKSTKKDE